MRALLQRVTTASVEVAGAVISQTSAGLLVLLGIGQGDSEAEARLLADKTAGLRIFADEKGRFNYSLREIGGAAMVVSQFTLYADTRKGRRPSFSSAAPPEQAAPLVLVYAEALHTLGVTVELGVFGANMRVALINEGPVTIMLDSATFNQPRPT